MHTLVRCNIGVPHKPYITAEEGVRGLGPCYYYEDATVYPKRQQHGRGLRSAQQAPASNYCQFSSLPNLSDYSI